VVIPAFNEEAGIGGAIRELQQVLGTTGWRWELLVVDDGSTDATAAHAEACGARLLRLGRNHGYGAALKAGIDATHSEWILITDADGTYPAAGAADLLREAGVGDMIVGSRVSAHLNSPRLRRPAKWILRKYAELLLWHRIPDLNSGMRLIRRTCVAPFRDLLPPGFSFTSTITLAFLANGLRVSFVPIGYLGRVGQSKIRPVDFFRMFRQITAVVLYHFPLRVLYFWGLALWAASTALLWPISPAALLASGTVCGLGAGLAGLLLETRARFKRAR
jgi:glycosyltransferase involved in cell wall biosynthesis